MSFALPSLLAQAFNIHVPGQTERILAHVNSLKDERERIFEGANFKTMLEAMAGALRTFPLTDMLTQEELDLLSLVFLEAANIRLSDLDTRRKLAGRIRNGEFVIVPAHMVNHCLYLVFGANFYAICNRGKGLEKDASTIELFPINSERFSHVHLNVLHQWKNRDQDIVDYVYGVLPDLLLTLDGEDGWDRLFHLAPGAQKAGNCAYANAKAALRILAALVLKHRRGISWKLAALKAYTFAKDLSTHTRLLYLDKYLEKIQREPDAFDPLILFRSWEKTRHRLIAYPILEEKEGKNLYRRVNAFFKNHIYMQREFEDVRSTRSQSSAQIPVPASSPPPRPDRALARLDDSANQPGPVYQDASP